MRLPEPKPIARLLGALAFLATLATAPLAAQEAKGDVVLSSSSLRLALMQLATSVDANVSDLIEAGPGEALYVQSGTATLAELADAADSEGVERAVVRTDSGFRLTRPLVVLQGARLDITEGQELTLDRTQGAFILALGAVSVEGATLRAEGTPYDGIPGFKPFLAGVGQRSLSITDSTLSDLGYGGSAFTGGVFVGAQGLLGNGSANPLTGNDFSNLRSVTLSQLDDAVIRDNRFAFFRGSTLRMVDGADATITDNLFSGTRGAHALHLSGLRSAQITSNTFDFGGGKALRIDDNATRVTLADNDIAGFEGTAVTVAEGAGCVRIRNNTVAENIGGGIALDMAGTVILDENTIAANRGAGLAINGQPADSTAFVFANRFDGNRMGVRGTGLATVRLARNDLSDQMPRLLAGDLDQVTPTYLDAARGGARPDIVVDKVSARVSDSLRKDAAARAFAACGDEETL
ncbi:right-handed parallel beta-helix repeat-containing protein [Maritimibacter sp. UBA3975]|uniref:right-handed parallel beta-helix repeat-containing protein n=1 Tax=Maritimibacter sp. UBA3975 TaxID=1946833 RepID=UPI000C0B3D01|nr:right-handed parallel beta-helix repeat-containing protein [Maritimibacter sp. UBA3975]MAM62971.1 hypothetical protein [Maritimibacter sp.]|tara:strand:+ start:4851 stop:6242 length:1392 start_codon:yes stop_codon:yes gene_type:complete